MSASTPFSESRPQLLTIGASEAAGVLNCSPWDNPFSIFQQKMSRKAKPVSAAMRWGKRLEDLIAGYYADTVGQAVHGDGETVHVSPFWPWLHATPDRWRADGGLVEIKTAREPAGWGSEFTDEIPAHHKVQCQHQMAVLNCERMDLAVLIAGSDFRVYHLQRDHDFVTQLVEVLRVFYEEHLLTGVAPPWDWSHPATLEALTKLEKLDRGRTVTLAGEEGRLLEEYLHWRARQRDAAAELEVLKTKILGFMGDAGRAVNGDGSLQAYRRVVSRQAYQVAPSTYVRLDVHERKEKA